MPPSSDVRKIQIAAPVVGQAEWVALREPITSGWLTQGPKVRQFEQAFAARHDVKHALATTSCTTALHLALTALGVGPGDEVIVPAFTWIATANVVRYCNATPVFVDVRRDTYNLDVDKVREAMTNRTKAIIAVHLFGLCADMDALLAVAGEIPVVEDAACAAGASYRGRSAGALGRLGCFSFHPRKSITTGEGGMVTTNDGELAERINILRNHGATVSEEQRHHGPQPFVLPDFNVLGFNYRMTDLQGAIGLVQLQKLDQFICQRRQRAEYYRGELSMIPWLRTPSAPEGYGHGWQAYVCFVDQRRAPLPRNVLMQRLQEMGISTRPGTHSVPQLGYYRRAAAGRVGDFPVALDCERHTLAIPLHNRMTTEDCEYVVRAIRKLARHGAAA